MNYSKLLPIGLTLTVLACSKPAPTPPPAPVAAPTTAPATASVNALSAEAAAIQTYVDQVEAEFRDKYQQKEIALTPGLLKGVTDAAWQKMHAYLDQGVVKRIKLYPAAGATKVEEFYYRDGQLVYVSDEPTGTDQGREQYFFGNGQLLAATETDGKVAVLTDAEKIKGSKLVSEAASFLKIASAP